MPMTVRELVDDRELGLRVVVDGPLDRPIRWVHTTELADPSRYLQGDELILTTGVWRDAGISSERFVAPLRTMDVAALGYGIATAGGGVPDDLEAACREAGLPLIAVPFELPFIAVNPKTPTQLVWPVFQTYADGERVEWTGAPDAKSPASTTDVGTAGPAPFGGRGPMLTALAALALALIALGLALRPSRPIPPRGARA